MLRGEIIPASELRVSVDEVLQEQGAKPEIIRTRRPDILHMTEDALALGYELVQPVGWIKKMDVKSMLHQHFVLENDLILKGTLPVEQMAGSRAVTFAIGTLGMALDHQITTRMKEDAPFAISLDAFGSAMAEVLARYLEERIHQEAAAQGLSTSLAISPGLVGWPVEEGQPQIFSLIQPDPELIRLSDSAQMIPRKSISFVMGIGCPEGNGTPCQFCDLRDRCPNRKN